jgi:ABC-type antimicrobial peptide transport system permease subunit
MYTIPAILLGFASSFPFLALMYGNAHEAELTGIFLPIPSGVAVLQALLIGLFIPFFSSLLPINKVLN